MERAQTHYLDEINSLARKILSYDPKKPSLYGNAERYFASQQGNVSLTENEFTSFFTHMDDLVQTLISLTEGESRSDTLGKSARFLGSLFHLSPGGKAHQPKVNKKLKPLYRAVTTARFLDELLLEGYCKTGHIRQHWEGTSRFSDKNARKRYLQQVITPLYYSLLSFDAGLFHPEAKALLSGECKHSPKDEFRTLNNNERRKLLEINERHSLSFLKLVLERKKQYLRKTADYDEIKVQEFSEFAITTFKLKGQSEKELGSAIKISQIYASLILATKREQCRSETVNAMYHVVEHANKGEVKLELANKFQAMFGLFPQGFGIACLVERADNSMKPWELAVVNKLYPADPAQPHCRIVTRRLEYNRSTIDVDVSIKQNLFFSESREKLSYLLSPAVRKSLEVLSSKSEKELEAELIPPSWDPHELFTSRDLSVWSNVSYKSD